MFGFAEFSAPAILASVSRCRIGWYDRAESSAKPNIVNERLVLWLLQLNYYPSVVV